MFTAQVCCLKTKKAKNGLDSMPKMSEVGGHLARTIGKGPWYETGVRNDGHVFLVDVKCYEKLRFVSLINKTLSGLPKLFS